MSAALRNDLAPERLLFVFSPNPETLSLHREEERRERGGCTGKLFPVDAVAGFYVRIGK